MKVFSFYNLNYKYGENRLKYAGIVGSVGFPLFYILYTTVIPQSYESFFVRLIATVLCFFLALKNKWPKNSTLLFSIFLHSDSLLPAIFPRFHDIKK